MEQKSPPVDREDRMKYMSMLVGLLGSFNENSDTIIGGKFDAAPDIASNIRDTVSFKYGKLG